jgi:hypothetical protein
MTSWLLAFSFMESLIMLEFHDCFLNSHYLCRFGQIRHGIIFGCEE